MTLRLPTFSEVLAVSRSRGRQSENPSAWDGLVGAWSMLQGGGATLFDVSGFGNNGTLTNMTPATDWVVGEKGYALEFDGANDYVRVPFASRLDVLNNDIPFTLSVLARPVADGQVVFAQQDGTGTGRSWLFTFGGLIKSAIGGVDTVGPSYVAGIIQQFGVTYDGTNLTVFNAGVPGTPRADGADEGASGDMIIGMHKGLASQKWAGGVNAVLIYSRAITPSAMQDQHVDSNAMFRLKRRVSVRVPDVGGLSIPIAAYHYNHHIGA